MKKMKKCNKCTIVKADDAFYIHEKSGKLYTCCIECVDIVRREACEKRKVRYENGKICPSCGELKSYTDYRPIDAESWKYSWRCDKCMRDSEFKKIESSRAYFDYVNYGYTY